RDDPHEPPDEERREGGSGPDGERLPTAVHEPREQVAPRLIRAERMPGTRGLQRAPRVGGEGVDPGHETGEQGSHDDDAEEQRSEHQTRTTEEPHRTVPAARVRTLGSRPRTMRSTTRFTRQNTTAESTTIPSTTGMSR